MRIGRKSFGRNRRMGWMFVYSLQLTVIKVSGLIANNGCFGKSNRTKISIDKQSFPSLCL